MRESGVLMHISSLQGPYGVGTMGKNAFAFVDFLKASGQSYWQILPLNPTGFGDSPYQSCSAFAGNPYLIDLELLIEEGLLLETEVSGICWCDREDKVNFGRLYDNRWNVLRIAYSRYAGSREFTDFCQENRHWLEDFSLFLALKDENGGKPWYEWEDGLKRRQERLLAAARARLQPEMAFYQFVQFLFFRQWKALHRYAAKQGVAVIGDVPIYVPLDSVDVWANPELFQLDETLTPLAVAGCPPDAFSEDGQLWGNPLYRWDVLQRQGYGWWLERLRSAAELYDVVRLDHFRGFESYWAVPYGEETARNGVWRKGPGIDFIRTVQRALPKLRLIAEDLGFLTPEVLAMREESGLPGMKVLQFAFDSPETPSDYLPHAHCVNSVCYTGTHDNMTTAQWLAEASEESRNYAIAYMRLTEREGLTWGVIRTAFSSVAALCIVPMQDFLSIGAEGRMNYPGTLSDCNWTWRIKDGIINQLLALRIRQLTALYDRLGHQNIKSAEDSRLN